MDNKDTIFADMENPETEASFFHKAAANFIDLLIEGTSIVVVCVLLSRFFPEFLSFNSYVTYIVAFATLLLYRLLCMLLLGKTVGMLAVRLKYLNADLEPLSVNEKLMAAAPIRITVIKIYKEQ